MSSHPVQSVTAGSWHGHLLTLHVKPGKQSQDPELERNPWMIHVSFITLGTWKHLFQPLRGAGISSARLVADLFPTSVVTTVRLAPHGGPCSVVKEPSLIRFLVLKEQHTHRGRKNFSESS